MDDLQLAPEGVAHKPLGELISDLRTGLNPRSNFSLNPPGATNKYVTVRELGGFDIVFRSDTDRIDDAGFSAIMGRSRLRAGDVLFSGTGTIGRTALVADSPSNWGIKEGIYALTPISTVMDARFLIYAFGETNVVRQIKSKAEGSTVASISMANLKKVLIPVPPLEIQHKIVKALDNFTQLEMELRVELEERKRQYAFYRKSLLNFSEGSIQWIPLGEAVGNLDSRRRPVTRSARSAGAYPYYGANGIQDYVEDYIFDGTFLLMGEDGSVKATDGSPVLNWATGKIWVNNHAHVLIERPGIVSLRFLFHYLQTVDVSPYVTGGTQPKLNQGNMNRILIAVPDEMDQKRIVTILDKFHALVNDPVMGIPAELSARRKQYEFYRNRLLTFEGLSA